MREETHVDEDEDDDDDDNNGSIIGKHLLALFHQSSALMRCVMLLSPFYR